MRYEGRGYDKRIGEQSGKEVKIRYNKGTRQKQRHRVVVGVRGPEILTKRRVLKCVFSDLHFLQFSMLQLDKEVKL